MRPVPTDAPAVGSYATLIIQQQQPPQVLVPIVASPASAPQECIIPAASPAVLIAPQFVPVLGGNPNPAPAYMAPSATRYM